MKSYWISTYQDELDKDRKWQAIKEYTIMFFISSLILGIVLTSCTLCHADKIIMKGYDNEEICEAIRHAEGINSRYPYGIKSVSCSNKNDCRIICIKTLRHYRKDFEESSDRGIEDFINYSSRRYVAGDTREHQENWIKNVMFYLRKGE